MQLAIHRYAVMAASAVKDFMFWCGDDCCVALSHSKHTGDLITTPCHPSPCGSVLLHIFGQVLVYVWRVLGSFQYIYIYIGLNRHVAALRLSHSTPVYGLVCACCYKCTASGQPVPRRQYVLQCAVYCVYPFCFILLIKIFECIFCF